MSESLDTLRSRSADVRERLRAARAALTTAQRASSAKKYPRKDRRAEASHDKGVSSRVVVVPQSGRGGRDRRRSDEQHGNRRREPARLSSQVRVPTNQGKRDTKPVDADDEAAETRKRARRMMGLMMNTLKTAEQETAAAAEVFEQRREVEAMVDDKVQQSTAEALEEERLKQEVAAAKVKALEAEADDLRSRLAQAEEEERVAALEAQGWLRTKTQPVLMWKPVDEERVAKLRATRAAKAGAQSGSNTVGDKSDSHDEGPKRTEHDDDNDDDDDDDDKDGDVKGDDGDDDDDDNDDDDNVDDGAKGDNAGDDVSDAGSNVATTTSETKANDKGVDNDAVTLD